MSRKPQRILAAGASLLALAAGAAQADQVFNDDVIATFSLCVGNDCVNGESFGFDTLRLKENNLRIHFDDTSTSSSFPSNDWRITVNDSSNGGDNYFGIEDSTAGRTPFRVDAGAPANSLRVDSGGDIGIGNSAPVVELHVTDGDSPTLRLEQNGSSGFTAQTWDIAGNEANFFVRDVTNGSQLPFKIIPGADHNALVIAADNNIGMGTNSPSANLHVRTTAAGSVTAGYDANDTGHFLIENANGTASIRTMAGLKNNGDSAFNFINTATSKTWKLATINNAFTILSPDTVGNEFSLSNAGDLTILGNFISGSTTLNVPDYVFEDSYELRPLSEVAAYIEENGHLPDVPSAAEINSTGLNMSAMQMVLLRKVEELTLYTLEQERVIAGLSKQLD